MIFGSHAGKLITCSRVFTLCCLALLSASLCAASWKNQPSVAAWDIDWP